MKPFQQRQSLLLLLWCLCSSCYSFSIVGHRVRDIFCLFAKKGSKARSKIKGTKPSSGFGGAAVEECPCGSGLSYSKCCAKLHTSTEAFAEATAEAVVRARYSAYAKREIDFIISSTHPDNKDFTTNIAHWRKTIGKNCYDSFQLTECTIINEGYEGEGENATATVQFVAKMRERNTKVETAFMETSTFERCGPDIQKSAWLYKEGVIADPPQQEE